MRSLDRVAALAWLCDVVKLNPVRILSVRVYRPRVPDMTSRDLPGTKIFATGGSPNGALKIALFLRFGQKLSHTRQMF